MRFLFGGALLGYINLNDLHAKGVYVRRVSKRGITMSHPSTSLSSIRLALVSLPAPRMHAEVKESGSTGIVTPPCVTPPRDWSSQNRTSMMQNLRPRCPGRKQCSQGMTHSQEEEEDEEEFRLEEQ